MNTNHFIKTGLVAALLALGLAGCQADSDGSLTAGPNGNGTGQVDPDDGIDDDGNPTGGGGNTDTGIPNDGSVDGGTVVDGDTPIAGGDTNGRFVCSTTAQSFYGATTEVGANGLVGGPLTSLLNLLGGGSATALLNSVNDKELAIDGTLRTASTFTLTASLLAGLIDSIDQTIILPSGTTVPEDGYAVFAVSFPPGLLNLGLLTQVSVTTYLNDVQQEEPVTMDASSLDLLGQGVLGTPYAFIGRKVTKPYNRATISLQAGLLAADVGESMYVHELCTGGRVIPAPTP